MNCCEQCGDYLPSRASANHFLLVDGQQKRFCCQNCIREFKQVLEIVVYCPHEDIVRGMSHFYYPIMKRDHRTSARLPRLYWVQLSEGRLITNVQLLKDTGSLGWRRSTLHKPTC